MKYIVDHPRSTLKDVAQYLKYKLEVSVKDDRARIGGIRISDLYKLVRGKEKRAVHVNYAGGWLLAHFIADMVKKTKRAFVTGLRPVDPENPVFKRKSFLSAG